MATSHKMTLVSSIMFHIKDKVTTNALVSSWSFGTSTKVSECLILIQLQKFQCHGVLPSCIAIFPIKFNGFLGSARNLKAILVNDTSAERD